MELMILDIVNIHFSVTVPNVDRFSIFSVTVSLSDSIAYIINLQFMCTYPSTQ